MIGLGLFSGVGFTLNLALFFLAPDVVKELLAGPTRFAFLGSAPPPACYANCDASTAAPALNVLDFSCFLQKFAAGCP